jgi:hypothetical protein
VLDLTTPPSTQISTTLVLREISNQSIRGRIRTANGEPLPFAWVILDGSPATTRVDFSTGEFVFYNPPVNAHVMRVVAPGYWSQAIAIVTGVPVTATLVPRPDTRHIAWGPGSIDVPLETVAEITDHRIVLVNGWVWGNGSGKFEIQSANTTIALESAQFAIELKPEQAWLYMSDGNAMVTFDADRPPIAVGPGQMLALDNRTSAQPVPLDPVAIRELTRESTPSNFVQESSLQVRLRDGLARAGISVAQLVTFATYCLVLLALVAVPAWLWNTWRRNRRP